MVFKEGRWPGVRKEERTLGQAKGLEGRMKQGELRMKKEELDELKAELARQQEMGDKKQIAIYEKRVRDAQAVLDANVEPHALDPADIRENPRPGLKSEKMLDSLIQRELEEKRRKDLDNRLVDEQLRRDHARRTEIEKADEADMPEITEERNVA